MKRKRVGALVLAIALSVSNSATVFAMEESEMVVKEQEVQESVPEDEVQEMESKENTVQEEQAEKSGLVTEGEKTEADEIIEGSDIKESNNESEKEEETKKEISNFVVENLKASTPIVKDLQENVVSEIRSGEDYKVEIELTSTEDMSINESDIRFVYNQNILEIRDGKGTVLEKDGTVLEDSGEYRVEYQVKETEGTEEGQKNTYLQIKPYMGEEEIILSKMPVKFVIYVKLKEDEAISKSSTVTLISGNTELSGADIKIQNKDEKEEQKEITNNKSVEKEQGTIRKQEDKPDKNKLISEQEDEAAQQGKVVELVKDAVLKKAILNNLRLQSSHILTKDDLKKLTSLSWTGGDKIKSLEGLQYAENLEYLNVSNNEIESVAQLSNLSKLKTIYIENNNLQDASPLYKIKNLTVARASGNKKIEEQVFAKEYVFKDIELMQNADYRLSGDLEGNNKVQIDERSIRITSSNAGIIRIEEYSSAYSHSYALIAVSKGSATISAVVGNIKKTFKVTCTAPTEEIESGSQAEEYPDLGGMGNDNSLFYQNSIWDITGKAPVKISGNKKIRKYVARKVYYGAYENGGFGDISGVEFAGLTDEGILYYWGKSNNTDKEYKEIEVAKQVKDIEESGYLDQKNVYHFWKDRYETGKEKHPEEYYKVSNVSEANNTAIVFKNGTSILTKLVTYKNIASGTYPKIFNFVIDKADEQYLQFASYLLDKNGILWHRKYNGKEDVWEKFKSGVSDYNDNGYLIGKIMYSFKGEIIAKNVRKLVRDGDYGYITTDNCLYQYGNYEGTGSQWRLVSKNVREVINNIVITNKGEVYNNGTEYGYLMMNSVKSISTEYTVAALAYNNPIYATRVDGSIWKIVPPRSPYCIFDPKNVNGSVAVPQPVKALKAQAAGKNKVTITWSKSVDAEGYLIYAQKSGKYGYSGMTTKGTTYSDTTALEQDYNFYWVYPYVKDNTGKRVIGKCPQYVYAKGREVITVPKEVKGLKAENAGKGKVKITWEKAGKAEGYLIYAQKKGKYAYCGMTTKGISYTDAKALDDEYNFYWVYPFVKDSTGKRVIGKCQKYVYAKGILQSVTGLKVTSAAKVVKLTWKESKEADGYIIYGKTASGSYGYKGMTTKATSYTDKTASSKEYNFYWIFPYHNNEKGNRIVGKISGYVYAKVHS